MVESVSLKSLKSHLEMHRRKANKVSLIGSIVFSGLFLSLTLETPAQEVSPPAKVTDAMLKRGEALYLKQCAACHGNKGLGDGMASYLLYPKPRDFSRVEFRLISTDNSVPSDQDLFRTITRGMPGSAMPPWDRLSVDDRWALVYYVKKLAYDGRLEQMLKKGIKRARAEKIAKKKLKAGSPIVLPKEPAVSIAHIARGRQIYGETCAACHGADGRGQGKEALMDSSGYPISARDFTQGIFKGSPDGKDLARRFLAGMPGTPMPVFKFKSDDDLWALVHYVQTYVNPGAQAKVEQSQRTMKATKTAMTEKDMADPASPGWKKVKSTYVALMPLWWRDDRVEGVEVRAVHNGSKIALHLSWTDSSKDDHALSQTAFGDGVAVELSRLADPPFFGMGAKKEEVNIWHWKSHWQRDLTAHADVQEVFPNMAVDLYQSLEKPPFGRHSKPAEFAAAAHLPLFLTGWGAGNLLSSPKRKSSAEDLTAQGFGTLATQLNGGQNVQANGGWTDEDKVWQVVFTRDLAVTDKKDMAFVPGEEVKIALAVWDGSARDRDGQKSVTIWHRLILDK